MTTPQEKTVSKVMEEIEKKQLHPIPRWKFVLKYFALWFLGGISVVSGAIAFSLTLLFIFNDDWVEYRLLHGSLLNAVFKMFPFVWAITFILFLLAAHFAIRHTKNGYRFRLWSIVGFNVALSLILGSVLYFTGISHWVDRGLGKSIPGYFPVETMREMMWFHPEEGRIAGEILEMEDGTNSFILQDPSGKEWLVIESSPENGVFPDLHADMTVGAVGEEISEGEFQAQRIKILPSPEKRGLRDGSGQGAGHTDGQGRVKEIQRGVRNNK